MDSEKLIYWFEEIGAKNGHLVGNKCANLGEMIQLGVRISQGFAVSANCYIRFVEETGAKQEIIEYIRSQDKIEGIRELDEASRKIRAMIEDKELPGDMKDKIASAYELLSKKMGTHDAYVAVRSSSLSEDSVGASFAGQFESYLNVKGNEDLFNKVKKVWSSTFTSRAISYRTIKKMAPEGDSIGVAVLAMVNARSSGITFTVDPVTDDFSKMIIEANWGLGEGVVSGGECVDGFVVDKESLNVIKSHIANKVQCVVRKEDGTRWAEVPAHMQAMPCISDEEVKEIAKVARYVEASLGCPQDMEWAIDQDLPFPDNIFWLQTRPAKVETKKIDSPARHIANLIARKFGGS